jgi:hypothetical protein
MIRLGAGCILAIAFALLGVSSAWGQGPDVKITMLGCTGDPELVVIENRGDADQPLAGWQLQSDPTGSEVYDLSMRGELLLADASIQVQSGPSASGFFLQDNWGEEPIFRDNDPTDYVRLVDDTGAVVQQLHCAEVAPEPSPTPSPEAPPLVDVPNGGGAPPAPGDALLAAMMVLVGGCITAAGVATGALSWLGLRCSPVVGAAANLAPRQAAARPHSEPRGWDGSGGQPIAAAIHVAVVGLLAAAVTFRLLRRRPR